MQDKARINYRDLLKPRFHLKVDEQGRKISFLMKNFDNKRIAIENSNQLTTDWKLKNFLSITYVI